MSKIHKLPAKPWPNSKFKDAQHMILNGDMSPEIMRTWIFRCQEFHDAFYETKAALQEYIRRDRGICSDNGVEQDGATELLTQKEQL